MLLVIHKCITFNPLTHSLIRQISTQTPSLTAKCRMGTEHTEKVRLLDFPTDLKWKNSVGSGSCPSPPFLSGVQLKDIIIGIIFINRWASFQVFWLLPNPELFGRQCLGMKLSHRGSLRFPRVSNPIYPEPVGWTHSAPGSQPLWASMQTWARARGSHPRCEQERPAGLPRRVLQPSLGTQALPHLATDRERRPQMTHGPMNHRAKSS